MNAEFDRYIKQYRKKQDKAVAISGETSEFFAAHKTEKLMQWFENKINQPIAILDFGCGDGVMTNFVKQAFYQARVVGVDPSGESIAQAQQEFPHITFVQTTNQSLPFPSNTFDIVYAAGVFHHINFKEHQSYLNDIVRVLKPGGSFVLFELNPLNPLTVLTFKRNPIDINATMLTPWYSKRLLNYFGKTKTIFYFFFPNFLQWFRKFEPLMIKIPFGALYATILVKPSIDQTKHK